MNEKLFNYAGTALHPSGETKVRFAQDQIARVKVNVRRGNSDIKFHELPGPMTKRQACEFLLESVELTKDEQFAVTSKLADLKKIERREAKKRGEVKVIQSPEELLKAIGSRDKIKA